MKALFAAAALSLTIVSFPAVQAKDASTKLDAVLASQPDHMKARYQYRHPKETLDFFGVKPGMKVADFLPGKDWYAGIMLPYLGKTGMYVGADLNMETWEFYKETSDNPAAFMAERAAWITEFRKNAEGWRKTDDAAVSSFRVNDVPKELAGSLDVVMAIRTFHLAAGYDGHLSRALSGIMKALKPGGVLGVVQHRAPENNSDAWASGRNGYVKQSALIAMIEAEGFELEGTSEINANLKDKPIEGDQVWRLPPTYYGSAEGTAERVAVDAIGETDRMTLKFRKPL